MFFVKSFTQRNRAKGSKSVKSAVFLLIALTLLFMGCSDGNSPNGASDSVSLNGTWNDDWGTMKINTSANTIEYVGNNEGKIVNSPNYSAVNGVLIIEFTKYIEMDYSNWPEVTSAENPDNIGKFGALYWRDLKSDSVYMAEAWAMGSGGYEHVMYETIEEARAAFTMDKAGEYVDWSILGIYTK